MPVPKHVVVPLAQGFEEIEAIAVIDVLRRAGVRVTVVAVEAADGLSVTGSHDVSVTCDARVEDCDPATVDAIVLPGGMPGTTGLGRSDAVGGLVRALDAQERLVAAICAAPTVLNAAGVLEDRRATSHPGHEAEMDRCHYVEDAVVVDGHVITSRGAGTAIAFAAAVVEELAGPEAAAGVLRAIQHTRG
jgi:4-methyl-5(b-hydroxyethyl)-thiazole monophosphate biosynthesis